MSYEKPVMQRWDSVSHDEIDPEQYHDLAAWCEQLEATEQVTGFDRVLRELAERGGVHGKSGQNVTRFADVGAFESAAIALIPQSAIYTGGRLKDGTFVAQVILDGGTGAHSRNARSLAMAWVAALLRALARQAVEARGANAA